MSTGKILLGLLAAGAAGAVLGILFAPEKGSTTRKKINRKSEDLVDGIEEKYSTLMDDIADQYESVKERATRAIENMKANSTRVIDNGKAKAGDIGGKVLASVK